ncbi:hypothetical protein GUJ93_ZPchr0015g6688 [Zizania palustris]|uniref:Uncharacterized protein n=1 Tax=Zizania palustris TaxID=103762 RepID=A0A8J5SYU2_ZIZPA|nr:hypothetical protein GUJ93_ZPchr0015g6688 [Zizania palustris]
MAELGINVIACAINILLSNHNPPAKAKEAAHKVSHHEQSDSSYYIPEDEEGVEGRGTDLDGEPITITYSTSKIPSKKKLATRKKLAMKTNMPPGSTIASKRVRESEPSPPTHRVATRSSKRQLFSSEPVHIDIESDNDVQGHPINPGGGTIDFDQDGYIVGLGVQ